MARHLAWTYLLVGILFIVFIGGTYPWMGSQVVRITTQLLVGAIVIGWLALGVIRPAWLPPWRVALPLVPALVVAIVSAATSPLPRVALESATIAAVLMVLWMCFLRLGGDAWF